MFKIVRRIRSKQLFNLGEQCVLVDAHFIKFIISDSIDSEEKTIIIDSCIINFLNDMVTGNRTKDPTFIIKRFKAAHDRGAISADKDSLFLALK